THGKVVGLFGTARNVSEQVEREAALQAATRDAEAASRAKSDFLANMSHEIRTPMNAIVGYTQLMESTALDSAQRGYLEHIDQSSRTLLTIIDDILNLSRLEAGRMAFDAREFEIREVVAHAVDMLAPQAYSKGLTLRTRVAPDVPICFVGDPGRIRQVLANFLSNAVKFTHHGLVEVHVSVERQTDRNAILRLAVRDTGRGISREDRQQLFEPFTASSRRTEGGGAGLGLTIARALIHAMGGELSLQSATGD
ncbi:MAG: ATP-binding protein, partial [Pseudomonadota bacterium]